MTFDTGFLVLFRGDAECMRFEEYIPEVGDQGDDAFDVLLLSDTCGIVCMNRWDSYDDVTNLHEYLEQEYACTALHIAVPTRNSECTQVMRWFNTAFGWNNLTLHAPLLATKGDVQTVYDDELSLVDEGHAVPS